MASTSPASPLLLWSPYHFAWQYQAREQKMQKASNDNLELQQGRQKINTLRAQLEPHFLFNALNAISALVRTADKKVAINALNRLSELLRYALTACKKDWVRIDDELRFVSDYLALQQLRYGERLQLVMHGLNEKIRAGDCPTMLLQPLVENALRHDLDCHSGASDIVINWQLHQERLVIRLSNPVCSTFAPNPGMGLGLANTAARLALLYDGQASLQTELVEGRFVVQLNLPLYAPEQTMGVDTTSKSA
jgi:two-component system, LytTR family, sensor histidine kinase AlgZ